MKLSLKSNIAYYIFKVSSIVVACALPLWGVIDKFPIWVETHGTGRSLGTGGLIGIIILIVIFRRTVFNFLKEKWKMRYAPPITIWIAMIAVSYMLMYINKFLYDITTVFWMGLIGCALGGVLTFIGENFFGGEKTNNE
jgi:hypothetical protein